MIIFSTVNYSVFPEMKELRKTSGNAHEDNDMDAESRYGNGVIVNGNRRGSSNKKLKYDMTRHHHIRHTNTEKSLQAKKRVIKMLFLVVVEFFVCWTPVYILQTWSILDYRSAMHNVTPMTMNLFHLLCYVSSCCNPITYCFMNRKFRQGFLSAFDCCGYHKSKQWREASSFGLSQRTGKSQPLLINFKKATVRLAADESATEAGYKSTCYSTPGASSD